MPVNSFENYPMSWKPSLKKSAMPFYKQLAGQLEKDISDGRLKPGAMLPPQRELADYLDINVSTVTRAFKLCVEKGIICGTTGRGTFVSSDVTSQGIMFCKSNKKPILEMGAVLPSTEPNEKIVHTIEKLLKEPDICNLFQYEISMDCMMQKKAGVKWLSRVHLQVSPDSILIASGGQNGLTAVLASLFLRGDKIGTNKVVYHGIKTAANMLGIQLVPLPEEDGELSAEGIKKLCKNEGLKGVYLIPDYLNPTTHTMNRKTRIEIAQAAKEYDLIVIEDGINSLLKENPIEPIAAFAPEQTIYISSISKTISPGLRIAFLTVPEAYRDKVAFGLYNFNIMVSPLLAEAAVRLINSDGADKILEQRRKLAVHRNRIVNEILNGYMIYGDEYCTFCWLLLPDGFSGRTFELCAKNAGVQVYGSERFLIGSEKTQPAVRIALTAEKKENDFMKGLLIIKGILEDKNEFTYF